MKVGILEYRISFYNTQAFLKNLSLCKVHGDAQLLFPFLFFHSPFELEFGVFQSYIDECLNTRHIRNEYQLALILVEKNIQNFAFN